MKFNYKNNMTSGIIKLMRSDKNAVKMALGNVGLAILQDTIQQDPKPPFETSYLRGAQFMYVQGKSATPPGALADNSSVKEPGDPSLSNDGPATIDITAGEFNLTVGLNTPYAMAQHENLGVDWFPTRFSRAGTPKSTGDVGGKFLEAKLSANKSRYAQIFAEVFSREWGKR